MTTTARRLLPLVGPRGGSATLHPRLSRGGPRCRVLTSARAEAQAAFDALDRHLEGDALRRVRNAVGPSGLDMVRL